MQPPRAPVRAAALPVVLALVVAGCSAPVVEPGSGLAGAGTLGPSPPAPPEPPSGPWPPPEGTKLFRLEEVLTGLDTVVGVVHAGDGSGRLFVVEKTGTVRVWKDGALLDEPFLDLHGRVSQGMEQGLLSIAFPPDFEQSRRVYVHFTDEAGDTNIVRYIVRGDQVEPATEHRVFFADQPAEWHNGGPLAFGPDGFLYVALGDGGESGRIAQDLSLPFGKILRLDVSGAEGYTVPEDNPFVATPGALGEVWVYGLRNPWRMSFDRATGDIFLGDVGNAQREEVDWIPARQSALNFGWNSWEGTRRNQPHNTASEPTWPIAEYAHDEGCAVMGGYVYRGAAIPALQGTYLYGDYCRGTIHGLRRADDGAWVSAFLHKGPGLLTGFGEDEAGELYAFYFHAKSVPSVMAIVPP